MMADIEMIDINFEADDTGKREEIKTNVYFHIPKPGVVVPRPRLTFTKITCVQFKDTNVCWIRNNGRYMCVQNNELRTNDNLTSRSDKNFQFLCTTFHGLEARTVGNTMCPALFFCAFKSAASGTFIKIRNNNVGLERCASLRRDIWAVRKPDSRFFKVHLVSKHTFLLKSLVYEDMYLSCDMRGLSMKKGTPNMNDISLISPGFKFEILTPSGKSLM